MELIRNISLIIFGIVAVVLVISNYLPLFRDMIKDRKRKNKGNNYNDELQNKRFHKFLTPQVMKEIVGVEGKNKN